MKKAILTGYLTKNIELKKVKDGKIVANIGIAVHDIYSESSEFYDVAVWGKLAERCSKFLEKGSKVLVEGRLNKERFTNKEGRDIEKITITATEIEFLSRPNKKEEEIEQEEMEEVSEYEEEEEPISDNEAFDFDDENM